MSQPTFNAIRGMNDRLPTENAAWVSLQKQLTRLAEGYGYQPITTPIVEKTALFKRAVGNMTDIVEKEMYTFEDRNGDALCLRPEGTAGCVRAAIEHHLCYQGAQRLYYCGPMFRRERPQKGRYRQFFQFGFEALGMPRLTKGLKQLKHALNESQQIYRSLDEHSDKLDQYLARDNNTAYDTASTDVSDNDSDDTINDDSLSNGLISEAKTAQRDFLYLPASQGKTGAHDAKCFIVNLSQQDALLSAQKATNTSIDIYHSPLGLFVRLPADDKAYQQSEVDSQNNNQSRWSSFV